MRSNFLELNKDGKKIRILPLERKTGPILRKQRPVLPSNWTKITSSHETELFGGNELHMGTCILQLVSSYASLKGNDAKNVTIEK